jgi:hypothetical protein
VERLVKGPLQTLGAVSVSAAETEEKDHKEVVLLHDEDYYEPGSKKKRVSSALDELPSFRKGSTGGVSAAPARPSHMPAASPTPPPRPAGKSLFSHTEPKVEDSLPPLPTLSPVFPTLRPLAPLPRSSYKPQASPSSMSPPAQNFRSPQAPMGPMSQPPPIPRQPTPYFLPNQAVPQPYPPMAAAPQAPYGYPVPPMAPPPYTQPYLQQPPPQQYQAPTSRDSRPKTSSAGKAAPGSPNSTRKMRDEVSEVVVKRLQHFNRAGRIADKEDFKRLARKLTHTVVEKETGRRSVDDALKRKISQFVDRFFEKNPGVYAKQSKANASASSSSKTMGTSSSSSLSSSGNKPDSPVDDDMYIVS